MNSSQDSLPPSLSLHTSFRFAFFLFVLFSVTPLCISHFITGLFSSRRKHRPRRLSPSEIDDGTASFTPLPPPSPLHFQTFLNQVSLSQKQGTTASQKAQTLQLTTSFVICRSYMSIHPLRIRNPPSPRIPKGHLWIVYQVDTRKVWLQTAFAPDPLRHRVRTTIHHRRSWKR